MIRIEHNAAQLARTLRHYAELSGKTMNEVLAKKGRDLAYELYRSFGRYKADPRKILAAAEARHYAMGRRGNRMTPARAGISLAAWRAADKMLQGRSADAFRVTVSPTGIPIIRRARWSGRRSGRLLRGGRKGDRFARSARRWHQLTPEQRRAARAQGIKILNRRALATAIELRLRMQAAYGGLMRIQWLPKELRRRRSTLQPGRRYEVKNRRGRTLGTVRLTEHAVILESHVPGTDRVARRTGAVEQAIAAVERDTRRYIERKLREMFR